MDKPKRTNRKRPMIDRFMAKVAKQDNGCWIWQAGKNLRGQPIFAMTRDTQTYAHRVACKLYNVPLMEWQCINRKCRQMLCVNPEHFEIISRSESAYRATHKPPADGLVPYFQLIGKNRRRIWVSPEHKAELKAQEAAKHKPYRCHVCENVLSHYYTTRKFCSAECRRAARKRCRPDTFCALCGAKTTRPDGGLVRAKYCSDSCRAPGRSLSCANARKAIGKNKVASIECDSRQPC